LAFDTLFRRYLFATYCTFWLLFVCDYKGWQFYFFAALIVEVIIVIGGCYSRLYSLIRLPVMGFVGGVWAFRSFNVEHGHLSDELLFEYLSNVTYTNYSSWSSQFESCSILSDLGLYFATNFLSVYVAYYCATLVLFAPLIVSAFLLCFGYLIGYVLAGRLATAFIFLAALASYYLAFLFPYFRGIFKREFGRPLGDVIVRPADDHEISGRVSFHRVSEIEKELIRPFEDEAAVKVLDASTFNLHLNFGKFVDTPFLASNFEIVIDSVSLVMVSTITTISFFVHLYSTVYMKNDPHQVRFFALLSLFTFFMLLLVMAGDFVILYIGWEGVGLSSFLLIGFWYTRVQAQKAALKAMLINKIGDSFLILAISLVAHFNKGSTNIALVPLLTGSALQSKIFFDLTTFDLLAVAILLAAFVKSAQLFFHTWLADAMEGPTPVSALLHAATMVTAGVYLVVRFSYVFEFSAIARKMMFIGAVSTVIVSSLIALTQYDIKKIIAYSTCSQLGLMFIACSFSAYDFALFHFFNHAFFKCLLFLLSGVIIHQLNNEQDIRNMGGLAAKMPLTFVLFTVASLSLVGMPGFSGALSKDSILHLMNFAAFAHPSSWFDCFVIFTLNTIIYLTMAYTARLIYYVFLSEPRYAGKCFSGQEYRDVSYQERAYAFVFFCLAFMSIYGGRIFRSVFELSADSLFYVNVHHDTFCFNFIKYDAQFDTLFWYIAYIFTLHALFTAMYSIHFANTSARNIDLFSLHPMVFVLFCFFNKKCYFDDVYNVFLVWTVLKFSNFCNIAIENGIFRYITSTLL
jgi:proton-translocating NADH-quinone oxidoreductase chain L